MPGSTTGPGGDGGQGEGAEKATGAEYYSRPSPGEQWFEWSSDKYVHENNGLLFRILSKNTCLGPGYLLVEFVRGNRIICPAECVGQPMKPDDKENPLVTPLDRSEAPCCRPLREEVGLLESQLRSKWQDEQRLRTELDRVKEHAEWCETYTHLDSRASSPRQINDIISERNDAAAEVVRLRRELESERRLSAQLMRRHHEDVHEIGHLRERGADPIRALRLVQPTHACDESKCEHIEALERAYDLLLAWQANQMARPPALVLEQTKALLARRIRVRAQAGDKPPDETA